jgi:hypothetical protein
MNVQLYARTTFSIMRTPATTFEPLRWSWRLPGGCHSATVLAKGGEALAALGWLGCGIDIYTDEHTVWHGYIESVKIQEYGVSASLEELANRVAVIYSYVEPGSNDVGERRMTAWLEDTLSVQEWGRFELLASVDGASDVAAEGLRQQLLDTYAWPELDFSDYTPSAATTVTAELQCRGWWSALDRYYYAQTTPGSVDVAQKIATIASAADWLAGTIIETSAGVSVSGTADGETTALDQIEHLLRMRGNTKINAEIAHGRILRIYAEPGFSMDNALSIRPDGIYTALGQKLTGQQATGWAEIQQPFPLQLSTGSVRWRREVWIEEASYDARRGEYSWRPRGRQSPWALLRLQEG